MTPRRKTWAAIRRFYGDPSPARHVTVDASINAELTEAKARALEEAAEAIEREEKDAETAEDAAAIRASASWLRSRAADVRAGR